MYLCAFSFHSATSLSKGETITLEFYDKSFTPQFNDTDDTGFQHKPDDHNLIKRLIL